MSRNSQQSRMLRRAAERALGRRKKAIRARSPGDAKRLIHELEVHQVELEMQNQALRQAQEQNEALRVKYQDLFEGAPVGCFILDRNGLINDVNPAGAKLLGADRKALRGRPFFVHLTPDARHSFYHYLALAATSRGRQTCELELKRPPGRSPAYISVESAPLRGKEKRAALLLMTARDVTGRVNVALALGKSERTYRTIADSSYDWEYWKAPDGALLYCSPSCERVTGYRPADFMADPHLLGRIVVPQDRLFFISHDCRVMSRRSPGWIDFRIRHKDGTIRRISHVCRPVFGDKGAYLGIRGSNRDITSFDRESQKLIEDRDLAQLYFEMAGIIMVVINTDQTVSLINAKGCAVLGYRQSEIEGRNWFDAVIPASIREETRRVFKRLVAGKARSAAAAYFENPVLTKQGEERFIAWHNAVLRDSSGQVIGTLSSGEDITRRREAEKHLARSERKYRTIVETTQDGFWYVDTGGRFLDVNRAACRLLGYTRAELLRMKIADIEAGERPRNVARHIAFMRKAGGDRFETRHRRKDGRVIDVEVMTTFSRDAEREECIFVFVRDITARKRSEELLRDNMEMMRGIAAAVPVGLGIASDRTIEWVSDHFLRMTGYDRSEVIGRSSRMFYPDAAEHARVGRLFYAAVQQTGTAAFETRWKRKDGAVIDIYLTGSMVSSGGRFPKIVFAALDITGRKRAEERIREDSERFRKLFDESRVGAMVNDLRGRILMANPAFSRFLGYTEKELRRLTVEKLTHPDDRQTTVRVIRRAARRGTPVERYQKRYIHKNGSVKWGEVNASVIRGAGGKPDYMIAQIQDITEHKRATEALARSEERYRRLLDSAADAVLLADGKGCILEANKQAEELFGRSKEELRRTRYVMLHPPEARRGIVRAFRRIYRSGIGHLFDTSILSGTGQRVPVDITGSAVMVAGEKIVQGVFRDMTDRKRAQEYIRSSEERFRRFSDASGYGFAMGDLRGQLIFGNPAICRMVEEKTPADFTRRRFYDYYTRKDAARLRNEILPLVLAKGQWVGELPLVSARGAIVHAEQNIFLIRDARGKPHLIGNIITDISKHKKSQAMIAEWKKSYELIIAATGQVAYDYNIKTGLVTWGGNTEKVFGYPRMEDNIVRWAAKIHPDDRPHATAVLDECMKKLTPYDLTYRYRHRDGRYLWVHDRGFYLHAAAAGKAERMLGIMQDVTELKHLDEAKKELIRAVSHELKTPIGMSRMALDMLSDAIRKWDMRKLQTAKGIIERNTERLDRDVENVLELFTLESIEALTHKARCSIRTTVEDVLSRVRYVAEFKKVGVRVRLSADADAVIMTKADLKALVYNMLDNAIKFTEKGHVAISTRRRGPMAEITVRDTGVGVAPSDKERLFTTFFKAHPSLPGTGLGLAICRDIATRYGGSIAVESAGVGKGTLVTVRLPVAGKGA